MRRLGGLAFLSVAVAIWLILAQGNVRAAGRSPDSSRAGSAAPQGTQFVNSGFEDGPGVGWTQYSRQDYDLIVDSTILPPDVPPHAGSWAAWLGGTDSEQAYVKQQVMIPGGTPVLGYWHWIDSTEVGCSFDTAKVLVNGTPITSYGLCEGANTNGWVKRTVDLSLYTGLLASVQVQVDTAPSYISSLYIDDVALEASPLSPLTVSISRIGTTVRLSWQHAAGYTNYEAWRSTQPYFLPGQPGSEKHDVPPPGSGTQVMYDDTGASGSPSVNYFYVIRGSGSGGATRSSNRTAEFDFSLVKGAS